MLRQTWMAPNQCAWAAFMVSYIEEGGHKHTILNIVDVSEVHTGANFAKVFAKIFKDFGLEEKASC